jgi:hypothetical protein
MADLVSELASQTGLNLDLVRKGLGALLAFFKDKLGGETFGKLQAAVPDTGEAVQAYESSAGSSGGGLMGALAGLASKFLPGADAGKLLDILGKTGMSAEQVQSFLPKALELLKRFVPPDLYAQIAKAIPGLEALGVTAPTA